MTSPESIVERLRKVSMAKAKATWSASGKQVRKGDSAQDMREDLDDYHAPLDDDHDELVMPAADDPGWHHVGGPDDDGGSDGDDGSDGDVAEEDDHREKEQEKEKEKAVYVPRFRGGTGTTMSDEQRKKAQEGISKAAEHQKATKASRDKVYEKPRELYEAVRDSIDVNMVHGEKHGLSEKQIKQIIADTALADVDFGYGEDGPSGEYLFQITLPSVTGASGLRTIVGSIRTSELYVFHAGETGGSKFTRLKY